MTAIKEIFSQYPEEILQNTLVGKVISGEIDWENEPLFIHLEKMEFNQILFKYNEKPLRVSFTDHKLIEELIDLKDVSSSNFIFWISGVENETIEVKYLACGNGQIFSSDLDIGFGDNIIFDNKRINIEKLAETLTNDFVFKTGNFDFLFIQNYPSNPELSFTIYGKRKRADIRVIDNKWIVQKIVNKPFPKKHDDFLQLNFNEYKRVRFVESSKAKEAYETIKAEEAKGKTLIALWKEYSAIEIERAFQLKEKIGELQFRKVKNMAGGISRIKILLDRDELKTLLHENKTDILNTALELKIEQKKKSPVSNITRFNIKNINPDFSFDVYDDLSLLPESGCLEISLLGDEIVHKRRERALKNLRENRKFITKYLLFAIEGKGGAMPDKQRNEKPLTERTKRFLKDKFNIDGLTANQEEAVQIAINTPDLAVIQGPPGTGKSTVVAAVCDRIIEIAERAEAKNKKKDVDRNTKLILVSAFQNDTVEHIASKIYTLGLPTIKIGKDSQSNIRAEDKLIKEIQLKIDNSLKRLSIQSNSHRTSKQLRDIKTVYEIEKNEEHAKEKIRLLLPAIEKADRLWNNWKELIADEQFNTSGNEKKIKALKGLRTELESYNDDGFEKIIRLQKLDLPFSDDEKIFLDSSPDKDPSNTYLSDLQNLKDKYLEQINDSSKPILTGNNLDLLAWLDEAIDYFKLEEGHSFEDKDTFLASNLETLREELDGNTDYIRETIKSYSESLAATNQVAGSKEMSSFNVIENVILEEAARSNPLDLLIPMSAATERIIMVGDQNQLPHLLEDDIADETSLKLSDKFQVSDTKRKLEDSLFGVIFKNLKTVTPRRTITLTEQFRMHPFIGDFISKIYYQGELKSGLLSQAEHKKHSLQLSWAKDKVAVFCDVKNTHGLEESGKSKSRVVEAKRIFKLLDELQTDPNFENLSVGIITFYAKQVTELYREANQKGYAEQKPDGSFEISQEYKETKDGREKLRIGSVDSFQGKEFDIVILSTVRSNEISRTYENQKKVFGFLTLSNRLNVAFSRSQKLLIVVGDGEMFSDDYAETHVKGLHEFYNRLSTDSEYGNRIQ